MTQTILKEEALLQRIFRPLIQIPLQQNQLRKRHSQWVEMNQLLLKAVWMQLQQTVIAENHQQVEIAQAATCRKQLVIVLQQHNSHSERKARNLQVNLPVGRQVLRSFASLRMTSNPSTY